MSYKMISFFLMIIFNILSNIVLQADPELTVEFFENVLKGLSVEHDATTGTNKLYLHL